MDAAAHYRNLIALGRAEFLASAAPAALVRYRSGDDDLVEGLASTLTVEQDGDATLPVTREPAGDEPVRIEVYPLAKKPGASFPDRITIGRTANNDLAIAEHSVSRLHAYVRQAGTGWVVADAGSKNGSWLGSTRLEPRKEQPLASKAVLRIGDVDLTFYTAADLFVALGGRA